MPPVKQTYTITVTTNENRKVYTVWATEAQAEQDAAAYASTQKRVGRVVIDITVTPEHQVAA